MRVCYWLELVRDGKLVPEDKLSLLLKGADEFTAFLAKGHWPSFRGQYIEHIKHRTSYMAS